VKYINNENLDFIKNLLKLKQKMNINIINNENKVYCSYEKKINKTIKKKKFMCDFYCFFLKMEIFKFYLK
jgi:hypothetical protein